MLTLLKVSLQLAPRNLATEGAVWADNLDEGAFLLMARLRCQRNDLWASCLIFYDIIPRIQPLDATFAEDLEFVNLRFN